MRVRPDDNLVIHFHREGGQWTILVVEWEDGLTDGVDTLMERRSATYQIANLDTTTKQALQTAWNGMKAYRDSLTPL